MGIGAAMLGVRPVMELMFWSFAYVAFDQIINNAGLRSLPRLEDHARYTQRRVQSVPKR
jgi:pyruvate/2-oxoglutarate/acetoin dehydrogenase E1 component